MDSTQKLTLPVKIFFNTVANTGSIEVIFYWSSQTKRKKQWNKQTN